MCYLSVVSRIFNARLIVCFSSFFLLGFLLKIRSMLLRDLQSVVLYDQEGKFAGIRRPNSKLPIEIDGTKIVIVEAIGSSGLDLKVMAVQLISPSVPKKVHFFILDLDQE